MRIKRVLLITPPAFSMTATNIFRDIQPEPPMGLAYIGAFLEGEGIEVKIVDSLIEGWERAVKVRENAHRIAGIAKALDKDIITGMGGAHPTVCPELVLADASVDKDFTLDDLFIRSFSINTPEWTGEKVREVYQKGRRWLLLQHFKRHPVEFVKKYLKLLSGADLMSIKWMLKETGVFKKKKKATAGTSP